jgi:4-nitrophenyl phosphatase
MTWVLDLDGVVWRGDEPIAGSPEAIGRLKSAGKRVLYVTNNAWLTTGGYVAKLQNMGIDAELDDVIHAGHAVASLIETGETVLLCAGFGVAEAIGDNAKVIDVSELSCVTPEVDVVVVGIRENYRYEWLTHAAQAVLAGARMLAPSADPLYPIPGGFQIGGGAAVAAVSYATGVEATVAGKPFEPIARVVRERLGSDSVEYVVGDQIRTEGHLARLLDAKFAFVQSGVPGAANNRSANSRPADAEVIVDMTGPDLDSVVAEYLEASK